MIIGLKDKLFAHAQTASNGDLKIKPKNIIFDRTNKSHNLKFFTDQSLDDSRYDNLAKLKIGWILESPAYFIDLHKKLSTSHYKKFFDYILTNNKKLLDTDSMFIFCPTGGTWIKPAEWSIYNKTKSISIIASGKNDLNGHKIRHQIVEKYRNIIDVYGREYSSLDNKLDGLRDYRYQIVVENCKEDYYFTEKLIDCFATGVIPIYWGCPSIANFFDIDGILTFDNVDELDDIMAKLSENNYLKKIKHIKNNFELAKKYAVIEDYIFDEIIPNITVSRKTGATI